ncbi:MAG: hypothetical protein COW16_00605, partial [Sphingomonadales bacterium CG12_big_fil_rev_8_21_14_0_65_65_10]
ELEDGFEDNKGFSIIGRGSAGVKLFSVSNNERIVSVARIDEDEAPENEAEEAIAEDMAGRGAEETTPHTTAHSDDNIEGEPDAS